MPVVFKSNIYISVLRRCFCFKLVRKKSQAKNKAVVKLNNYYFKQTPISGVRQHDNVVQFPVDLLYGTLRD